MYWIFSMSGVWYSCQWDCDRHRLSSFAVIKKTVASQTNGMQCSL